MEFVWTVLIFLGAVGWGWVFVDLLRGKSVREALGWPKKEGK